MMEQVEDYCPRIPNSRIPDRRATWPSQDVRNVLEEENAAPREMTQSWCPPFKTPRACEAVCFSRWTRFTTSPSNIAPMGELKASIVCKASGTTPGYDPPATERTYLGADQLLTLQEKTEPQAVHSTKPSTRYWTAMSTSTVTEKKIESPRFQKQQPKRVNTSSLLTESLKLSLGEKVKTSPDKAIQEAAVRSSGTQPSRAMLLAQRLGFVGGRCDQLPSTFDSDSEDETDDATTF